MKKLHWPLLPGGWFVALKSAKVWIPKSPISPSHGEHCHQNRDCPGISEIIVVQAFFNWSFSTNKTEMCYEYEYGFYQQRNFFRQHLDPFMGGGVAQGGLCLLFLPFFLHEASLIFAFPWVWLPKKHSLPKN